MATDREITREASESLVAGVRNARAAKDYAQVEALLEIAEASFQLEQMTPTPDPVAAASLAEVTNDSAKAISLFELAISQSTKFPGQATYVWRAALGKRLLEVGKGEAASYHLNIAKTDAVAAGDVAAVEEIDAMAVGRSNTSLERTRDR